MRLTVFASSRPIRLTRAITALPSSNCCADAPGSLTSNVSPDNTPSPTSDGSCNFNATLSDRVEKAAEERSPNRPIEFDEAMQYNMSFEEPLFIKAQWL